MIIVIDTREQKPWGFPGRETAIRKLATGDYSAAGYESVLCIERKTLADYVHSIIQEKKRFYGELARMHEMVQAGGAACVVVETTPRDLLDHRYVSAVKPRHIIEFTAALCAKNIPVFFWGDRQCAQLLAASWLARSVEQMEKIKKERPHGRGDGNGNGNGAGNDE